MIKYPYPNIHIRAIKQIQKSLRVSAFPAETLSTLISWR